MNNIELALDSLLTRYLNLVRQEKGSYPWVNFDPPWPSPCSDNFEAEHNDQNNKRGNSQDDLIRYWRPIERGDLSLFENLESALERNFPDEIKQFYGSFWSNGICVVHDQLEFNLIQIWNEEDESSLKENMLGHLFAKLKNKLALNYFIGCTDGNEVICVDDESKQVVLERPGKKAHQILAKDLESFLLALQPSLADYD